MTYKIVILLLFWFQAEISATTEEVVKLTDVIETLKVDLETI